MDMQWLVGFAPFLMVLGIVWITTRARIESKRLTSTAHESAEKAAQYATSIQALEDRVRVLERIVTDKGYDVATQIEALRDQRRVDDASSGLSIESLKRERV